MATNPDGSEFKPLFIYEVYNVDGKQYGYLRGTNYDRELERRYETVFYFRGREATYWIATNDDTLTRDQALQFSIACHEGRIKRYHVDLANIGR